MQESNNPYPPRLAEWIFTHLFPDTGVYSTLGDLQEAFEDLYETRGRRAAAAWYWSQCVRSIPPFIADSIYWGAVMLKNYAKIALRNMSRYKTYSIINVGGLAVGIASFLLIALYVLDELSYDRFHEKSDRIYRIVSDLQTPDQLFHFANTPPDLAAALKEDFPEISNTVRFRGASALLEYGNERFQANELLFVDSTFFDIFSFPLLQGDARALTEPYSIVLTAETARTFFGREDPLGKILKDEEDGMEFTVTGVVANVPKNSHFSFDALLSLSTFDALGALRPGSWFWVGFKTYIVLPAEYDVRQFESRFPEFIERRIGEAEAAAGQSYDFVVQPLTSIHLKSDLEWEMSVNGNMDYVIVFSIIAILVLLVAFVNFTNLSTARSTHRAREVGMRKVAGANRSQLTRQFLGESILTSLVALAAALLLAAIFLPSFSSLTGNAYSLRHFLLGQNGAVLVLTVLIVGVAAGSYPALVLSNFRPALVLKGVLSASSRGVWFRNSLSIFQFVASISLIVGTLVVHGQLSHLRSMNLGFTEDPIVVINFRGDDHVRSQYDTIKNRLLQHAGVQAVSASSDTPATTPNNRYATYESADGEEKNTSLQYYVIDYDFLDAYGIDVVAGRSISEEFGTDSTSAFLINESAVPFMGWASPEDALGKRFQQSGRSGTVVGVVEDFHFRSLHREIEPLSMYFDRNAFSMYSLRIRSGDLVDFLAGLEKSWNAMVPSRPFEFNFLDESLDQRYLSEARAGNVLNYFTVLALFIACLGLFGLASFLAEQQRREYGMRKVLGASFGQLLILFARRFTLLVLVSCALAMPLSYFVLNAWLETYPYRIAVGSGIMLLAGVGVLTITWLTVAYQSVRIARTNPAKILRYE